MGPLWVNLRIFALNIILITLTLTAPLLVGVLIIRLLRKGISEERKEFENDIKSKIGMIAELQAEAKAQFDELSKWNN